MIHIGLDQGDGLWKAHCRPCRVRIASTYSSVVFDDLERHVATAFHAAEVLLWRHHLGRAA